MFLKFLNVKLFLFFFIWIYWIEENNINWFEFGFYSWFLWGIVGVDKYLRWINGLLLLVVLIEFYFMCI